jgi:hypothetical protein
MPSMSDAVGMPIQSMPENRFFDHALVAQNMPVGRGSGTTGERQPLMPASMETALKPPPGFVSVRPYTHSQFYLDSNSDNPMPGSERIIRGMKKVSALLSTERKELDAKGAPQSVLNAHKLDVESVNTLFSSIEDSYGHLSSLRSFFFQWPSNIEKNENQAMTVLQDAPKNLEKMRERIALRLDAQKQSG